MTKEEIKQVIVDVVNDTQGCRAVELINLLGIHPKVIEYTYQPNLYLGPAINWNDLLDELVKEERLVEIRYVLPIMPNKLKSFLLPVGTHIGVKTGSKLEVIGEE